ncbi:ABC transporter permease subunit [Haloglycomyces albus]|uniref:ABC transporter permease subunit n=1 Tax=Haloglycomyces albus TaxID=526067 RepID=UPI00046CD50A|nr:ABC transporter permease subunit [Haloglycomyces albus]
MNLFLAELRRITHRRLTWIFMAIALGIVLLASGMTALTSHTEPTPSQLANAEEVWAADQERVAECQESPPPANDDPDFTCEDRAYSQSKEDYYDMFTSTFVFSDEAPYFILRLTVVGGLLMLILGSSLIGAEWRSGGMSNLLLWHPTRMKVLWSKLTASLIACTVALSALIVIVFLAYYVAAAVRGDVGTLDGEWWAAFLPKAGRAVVLSMFMALFGITITYLGRHTAIAGGVVAATLILNMLMVGFARLALELKYPQMWSLNTWVNAWFDGELTLTHFPESADVVTEPETMTLTYGTVGIAMLVTTVVLLALSSWTFRKRDIA